MEIFMEFNKYPELAFFKNSLSTLELELSDRQLQQFMDYYEMLVEKNKVMNLTAITN
jgi:16S rRNA (guanine527-N7)-methyltransferase